jgi:hypothetical protein
MPLTTESSSPCQKTHLTCSLLSLPRIKISSQGHVEVTASSGLSGPTTVFTLFQADNVTKVMYNIADYMTKSFRANNSLLLQAEQSKPDLIAPDQTINGTALTPEQIVRVQWSWLTLPVLVLLLATAFLCTVIATSRAHGIGAWKDSPLTLFFHDAAGIAMVGTN